MINNFLRHFYKIVIVSIIFFSSLNAFGQFEQKLTINGSASLVYPDMLEEYTSYGNGIGFDGGLQYNYNRTLSFYGATRFYYMFGGVNYEDAYYDNLSIGAGLKLNLLPSKKINPYLFGEANINFIWFEEYLYSIDVYNSEFGTSIGSLGGLGIDFMLNDNLAIYAQSGAYYTLWDSRINLYSQLGIRINLIKSKTI